MDLFGYMQELRYGAVHLHHDAASGLRAVIAVHNTSRGPGIGGTRATRYPSSDAAIRDAMRLARGMAYKAAGAELPHGGGKAVIMLPEGDFDREALFRAFGRFVDSLGGVYVTCEDSGTSTGDMDVIARETRHVLGTSAGSGDPSPFTAIGCRRGIEAAVEFHFGRRDVEGMHVAIQGVGHVGHHLATQLHELGARLTIADLDEENLRRTAAATGATMVGPDEILAVECDVLAPCALGAVFDDTTIPTLRTKIIGGAANNVLAEDRHGLALQQRGILYAPDYVINAGGLINVATEYRPEGYSREVALAKCDAIHDTLMQVFERARSTDTPTHIIADRIVEERIFG